MATEQVLEGPAAVRQDVSDARSRIAPLVRCHGFTITVSVDDGDRTHVLSGTPSCVLRGLAALPDDAAVLAMTSVLAATRTPTPGLRRPGWWG